MDKKKSKKKNVLKFFSSHLVCMNFSIEYYLLIEFFQEITMKKTDNYFPSRCLSEKYYKNYGIFGDLWKVFKEKMKTKSPKPLMENKKKNFSIKKKIKFFRKKINKNLGNKKNKTILSPKWRTIT